MAKKRRFWEGRGGNLSPDYSDAKLELPELPDPEEKKKFLKSFKKQVDAAGGIMSMAASSMEEATSSMKTIWGKVIKADPGAWPMVEVKLSSVFPVDHGDYRKQAGFIQTLDALADALGWVYNNDIDRTSTEGYYCHAQSRTISSVQNGNLSELLSVYSPSWMGGLLRFLNVSENFVFEDPLMDKAREFGYDDKQGWPVGSSLTSELRAFLSDPNYRPTLTHPVSGWKTRFERDYLSLAQVITSWCYVDLQHNPDPDWARMQPFYSHGLFDMKGEPINQDRPCTCKNGNSWLNCNCIPVMYFKV